MQLRNVPLFLRTMEDSVPRPIGTIDVANDRDVDDAAEHITRHYYDGGTEWVQYQWQWIDEGIEIILDEQTTS